MTIQPLILFLISVSILYVLTLVVFSKIEIQNRKYCRVSTRLELITSFIAVLVWSIFVLVIMIYFG